MTSIGVFYITDFALVVLYDERVDRNWLYAGVGSLGIASLCCFYCIVWLKWIKKVPSDNWETHNPFVIPIATISIIIGSAFVCKGLWAVWHVLTFPIVGTQFMGLIVVIAMVPDII